MRNYESTKWGLNNYLQVDCTVSFASAKFCDLYTEMVQGQQINFNVSAGTK